MTTQSHAIVYTDGSCKKNPGGPGAWAALIIADGTKIQLSGGFRNTTSNRMEMRAPIEALKSLHGNWAESRDRAGHVPSWRVHFSNHP